MKLPRLLTFLPLVAATTLNGWAQQPKLVVQTGHHSDIESVVFAPDNKTIASVAGEEIKVWNIDSRKLIYTLSYNFPKLVVSATYSTSGRYLAGIEYAVGVKVWDLRDGRLIYDEGLLGHSNAVWDRLVAFGEFVESDQDGQRTIRNGKPMPLVQERDDDFTYYSADGKRFTEINGREFSVWDTATRKLIATIGAETPAFSQVVVSDNGKLLALIVGTSERFNGVEGEARSSLGKSEALIWDTTAESARALEGAFDELGSLHFSPNGELLAATEHSNVPEGNSKPDLLVWETNTGRIVWRQPGQGLLAFASTSQRILSTTRDDEWDGETSLRDSTSGTLIWRGREDAVFSSDGEKVLTWSALDTERTSFTVLASKDGARLTTFSLALDGVKEVFFTHDDTAMAVISGYAIEIFDLQTRKSEGTVSYIDSHPMQISVSRDGNYVATLDLGGNRGYSASLYDLVRKTVVYLKGAGNIFLPSFSPDGTMLAFGTMEGELITYALRKDRSAEVKPNQIRPALTIQANSGYVAQVGFHPNGYLITSSNQDGSVGIFTRQGKLVATLVVIGPDDWVVVLPDGRFDGSSTALSKIGWKFPQEPLKVQPVETYFNDFYSPGLFPAIFNGGLSRFSGSLSRKDRRQPTLSLNLANEPSPEKIPGRQAQVKVEVSRAFAGAQDVRLFRNGSLVKVWRGDVLKGKPTATLEATIPIVVGENRLKAYAFNRDNIKSTDAVLVLTGADNLKRIGTVYIVAAGVNEYANGQYNLKYAVADAQDFASDVRAKQEALGQYERVEVVSLNDRDATKVNILKALSGLAAKVQPEDAVIIYFAGHGVAAGNRFYLVPHDLGYAGARDKLDQTGLDTILAHGISDEELQSAVEGIDAGQMLMVIDACNSGQALEAEEKRRGPMNSKGLAQLAYEKGMYILTAAQSYQAALEASKLGHGYLTYALVEEGLNTPIADTQPKDGSVLLREWLDYATTRVPAMQQEKLNQAAPSSGQPAPVTPEAKRLLLQQTVTFTNGEEQTDPAQRTLQRPRVFYRREVEPQPWVVAKP